MKRWEIHYHKDAYKFLQNENLLDEFEDALKGFIYESRRIDIKKLKGKWRGKYRVRIRNIRIIFDVDYNRRKIRVIKAGYRGDVYK
jgi:mRNA-degrading endonuclease RelE of RelBE toxin-antitoxin system